MTMRETASAPRARVGLLAGSLLVLVLGALLLAPGLRRMLLTALVGVGMGYALGWALRRMPPAAPAASSKEPPPEEAGLRAQVQGMLELVGVAAHDLSNPLLALQLRLHRLRHLAPDTRLQEGLAAAERDTRRMGRLLHELMDVSRLSAGRIALEREELDLSALAHEVAERFTEQAAAGATPLVVRAEAPVWGRWDRERLDRVLTNLLSNALKFGAGRPVEVRVQADGPLARLVVKDHGIGIPPEAQGRLFGRFERVGGTGQPGTGLGLYIVRQLTEAHGGTVHLSSQPHQGAAFTLELPRHSLPHIRSPSSSLVVNTV
jgi:signal transduction histidine kinase